MEPALYALCFGGFAAMSATIALTPPEIQRQKVSVLQVMNGAAWCVIAFSVHLYLHG